MNKYYFFVLFISISEIFIFQNFGCTGSEVKLNSEFNDGNAQKAYQILEKNLAKTNPDILLGKIINSASEDNSIRMTCYYSSANYKGIKILKANILISNKSVQNLKLNINQTASE